MGYKAVIFDLDGTLVHTRPEYRYKVVGQVLEDLRGRYSKEGIDKFWFETKRDEVIQQEFGLIPENFWTVYRKHDTMELRKQFTETYDDVDFLQELREKGFKTGLVTGAPPHIASLEISLLGAEKFDAVVIASNMTKIKPKPHPHGLEECLNLLEVLNSEAMYVGNAEEDSITAKNAKVFDVLLLRGEYKFPDAIPSLSINSLYDLRKPLGI